MAVTIEKFRTQFKAFAEKIEFDDSEIQPALDLAVLEMGEDPFRWGGEDKYDMLVLYLAAHHLVIMDRQTRGDSGRLGSVTDKRAGDVQVSYSPTGTPSKANVVNNVLNSTSYGMYHMMLKKRWRMVVGQTVKTEDSVGYSGVY